ncbi:hypothetical protein CPC08DRAFT_708439 [Agrocybe pediades]|nr:hypothetical protein CPC08DRAFT_708439 [Agrocybe pediades]
MGVSPEVALAVGVWVEALLYGLYACLFFEALYIIIKKRSHGGGGGSARVFMYGIILMFLLATLDIIVNLYRFLRAFVLNVDPLGPFFYFFDFTRWDTLTRNSILCIMTWIGDSLVIYRCYVVWDRRIWVTVLPIILLILSIASNAALLFWFTHPGTQSEKSILQWMATIYPFAFAQNTITTGMIAFKIWRQHRSSTELGVHNHSPLDLIGVMRIVVESAMIYTLQLLILIILFPLHHNAQLIVQCAIVPSIGIVFVLIAVRVHFSRSRTLLGGDTMMASMPPWLNEDQDTSTAGDEDLEQHAPRRSIMIQAAGDVEQAKRNANTIYTTFIRKSGGPIPPRRGQTTSAP